MVPSQTADKADLRPLGYLLRVSRTAALHITTADGTPVAEALRSLSILAVLQAHGPRSQQQLAEYLGINRSVMVKLIDSLEEDRLVLRGRNQADRRSYALAVTEKGGARAGELTRGLDEAADDLARQLAPSERRRLRSLLGTLVSPRYNPPLPGALAGSLLWLIVSAQEAMEERGDQELTSLGIDVRTYVALAVAAGDRCSQIALASHLAIGPAATVELVDRLEELGAARRRRRAGDRRSYVVEVTTEGQRLLQAARRRVRKAAGEFASPLDEAGRTELLGTLERLVGEASFS